MKTLGLIGGIGPESTIDYYRLLVAGCRERAGGKYPPVVINSVDLQRLIKWMTADELELATDYLVVEIEKLEKAGVDFAAMASNTPHRVFDRIQKRTSLPLVSIVEATCRRVQSLGMKMVGLLGTKFTMQARFYPEVFSREGINLIMPGEAEQNYIHEKYMGELLNNVFLPETRAQLLKIVDGMIESRQIEGLILGGTELPLLLRDESHNGIPLLDTTRIHVDELLTHMLE